jgi:periplasmic mercuric ion binding protein
MNIRVLFLVLALAACSISSAQDSTVQEAQIKVFGNCGMCKTRIEKAVAIKEVKYAKWNKSTKILRIAFRSPGITLDSLEQRIAAVGHDTEKFKAPDDVYASLPACCLYRNSDATH